MKHKEITGLNKVAVIALSAFYSVDKLEIIGDLIVNSTNPEVALEIALGIYELPDLSIGPEMLKDGKATNIQFVRYDRYSGHVHYTYNKVKQEYAWHNNETNKLVSTQESAYYAKQAIVYRSGETHLSSDEFTATHTRSITKTTVDDKLSESYVTLATWCK